MLVVPAQATLVYFPAPQTSHALHTVLLVVVHGELTYWVLGVQVSQVLHTVLLVALQTDLGYCPVEQVKQTAHTVLLLVVHGELAYWPVKHGPHAVQTVLLVALQALLE